MDVNSANLQSFVTAEDNPRIGASADDQKINISAGLVFGVILIILFAYVISVFTVHSIEKESSIIGTLYALGVARRELMRHYLMLPVVVTTLAGILGFWQQSVRSESLYRCRIALRTFLCRKSQFKYRYI